MNGTVAAIIIIAIVILAAVIAAAVFIGQQRRAKEYERSLKMIPMLIHLPPSTDDIQGGGRDERDVNNEAISSATVMYSIIASTLKKSGLRTKIYGQRHFSFEIICVDGFVKYYAVVPAVLTNTVTQAIVSSYPTARVEECEVDDIFAGSVNKNNIDMSNKTPAEVAALNTKFMNADGVAGGEFEFKKEKYLPIQTFEEMKWDAQAALLNAFTKVKEGEGLALQLMFRPADKKWQNKADQAIEELRDGKSHGSNAPMKFLLFCLDIIKAPFEVPDEHKFDEDKTISDVKQQKIQAIENKERYPAFEVLIRVVAASKARSRSEALVGGVVAAFSQFDSPSYNGFRYNINKDIDQLVTDYIFRFFPTGNHSIILNTMELASIYHLPAQNAIPASGVERQLTKQVDGPARLATEGILLGINEYRGNKKEIHLTTKDRSRHCYIIGATGMGKSVLLGNLAYQDMMDGRGFAFLDPHGDVVEDILSKVPPERADDVIYFDPSNMEYPMSMNMLEFKTEEEKDFIVQEGINMLYSLYDPGHTGIFGPRGEQMFRNAALLLMADPKGATFIDIPQVFVDPELVKEKLKYVKDKQVYDYWTKEFPASQKSNDSGEVVTWFTSKWSPFISNQMMKAILGQEKSSFNIRDVMDNHKILLVNLSKGKVGELNSKLLGMIFVMKFQQAAMSRVDTPEDQRPHFCLFVDEFQNYSTESFESILSEARKFHLNLIVANQFMTQLTDKIREGVLGNVGTIICGRVGVTDAEMMEKVFSPVFNAEDLHKQPNHHAIATVMMNDVPTSPFTMSLCPPMGERNEDVLEQLKNYSATRFGRPRAEVDREIAERMKVHKKPAAPADASKLSGGAAKLLGNDAPAKPQGIPLGVARVPASEAHDVDGNPVIAPAKRDGFLEKWKKDKEKVRPVETPKPSKEEVQAAASIFDDVSRISEQAKMKAADPASDKTEELVSASPDGSAAKEEPQPDEGDMQDGGMIRLH